MSAASAVLPFCCAVALEPAGVDVLRLEQSLRRSQFLAQAVDTVTFVSLNGDHGHQRDGGQQRRAIQRQHLPLLAECRAEQVDVPGSLRSRLHAHRRADQLQALRLPQRIAQFRHTREIHDFFEVKHFHRQRQVCVQIFGQTFTFAAPAKSPPATPRHCGTGGQNDPANAAVPA